MTSQFWQNQASDVTPEQAKIITHSGSLTAYLMTAKEPLSVQVFYSDVDKINEVEYQATGWHVEQPIFAREVALCLGTTPVILARSICLLTPTENNFWLKTLNRGTLSLGLSLFKQDANITRHPLRYAHFIPPFHSKEALYNLYGLKEQVLPARCGLFQYQQNTLLVSEFFLPSLFLFFQPNTL